LSPKKKAPSDKQRRRYSTLGTSVYYHSLLLAAQLLWDGKVLASTITAIREIDFDRLRDADGYLAGG